MRAVAATPRSWCRCIRKRLNWVIKRWYAELNCEKLKLLKANKPTYVVSQFVIDLTMVIIYKIDRHSFMNWVLNSNELGTKC